MVHVAPPPYCVIFEIRLEGGTGSRERRETSRRYPDQKKLEHVDGQLQQDASGQLSDGPAPGNEAYLSPWRASATFFARLFLPLGPLRLCAFSFQLLEGRARSARSSLMLSIAS